MVRVADCVPVLLADPHGGVIGAAHAGRKGLADGVVTACVEQMRQVGAQQISAWVGPHICGRCYEVPADMRDEVAAVEPVAASTTSWGTAALDIGAGVVAQLERLGVEVQRRVPVHARVAGPLLPPARRRAVPAGSRVSSGGGSERRAGRGSARRDRERAGGGPRAHRQSLRGLRAAAATRSPWSWSRSSSPRPTSGCSPTSAFATSVRTVTRRQSTRQPSVPTSTCTGTSSVACRATRPRRWPATPTSSTRSTGPSCCGGLSRGAQERGQDLECLVQVSLDPPDASGRSGAPVDQVPGLAERILETDGLRLRGVMGVAPLDGDPRGCVRPVGRAGRRRTPDRAGGDLDLRRDERRPRACDPTGCDTPADRVSGPRSEAGSQVGSEVPWKAAKQRYESRGFTDERDAEDGRIPRPARGR